MKPAELLKKVSRKADTAPKHSHVTASDVSRVHRLIWEELAALPSDELFLYASKEIQKAKKSKKAAKEKAKK